jgi:23S rRNA (guanosine2251-2'-O)-methyltransferase
MQNSFEKAAVLPGVKPVLELLASNPERIDFVYCRKGLRSREALEAQNLCRQNGLRFTLVEQSVLDRLCRDTSRQHNVVPHQGIVARLSSVAFCGLDSLLAKAIASPLPIALALDQLQDPGNIGTLARTLYALGGGGVIVPLHNSAHIGPAANKSSVGALQNLPLSRVANLGHALDRAAEHGFAVYGTDCGGKSEKIGTQNAFIENMRLPAILTLGNEQKGLRPGIAKRCDRLLRIPLERAFDSLNVAQAGAILLGLAAAAHACVHAVSFGTNTEKQ